MAQSLFNPLTASSPVSTANSTASGVSTATPTYTSQPSAYNSQNMPLMQATPISPATIGTSTQAPAAPTSATEMYNPQMGTSTQKVADATYANAMTKAASGTSTVPSTSIGSGNTLAGASAIRNTNESLLQQYLDQQKADRAALQAAQTPSAELVAARTGYADLTAEAKLAQEKALSSGETSAFAGGEAQRIGRTYDIKLAAAAAKLQMLETGRNEKIKALQDLVNSGQSDFKTQLEIQKLEKDLKDIDKQANTTLYNYLQKPEYAGIEFTPDPTKTPTDNLNAFRKLVSNQQATTKSYTSDPEVSSLYNRGLITGGTEAERQSRANQIASLPEDQKKETIRALGRTALSTTQQQSYQSNQVASSIINTALSNFDTNMVNNPYKYTANQYAGYFGGTKDPKYTQFTQFAETANAPIRQGYFGASLTTGENEKANSFLVDAKKDDAKTIVIKLNNMKSFADFTNDLMIYDQIGGTRPNLDDYLKLDKNGNPKQQVAAKQTGAVIKTKVGDISTDW